MGEVAWAHSRKAHIALLICTTALCLFLPYPASADDNGPDPRNNFGGVDLIDMPDARMAPDGEIDVGASFFKNTERYNFDFQALPWLSTSFKYSGLEHFNTSFPVYWDRSFQVKARLFNETNITPAVTVGIDDLVGTEIYGGEYLVASKRFGPFDATLGIGWGNLGTTALFKNPLTVISQSFAVRPSSGAGAFTLSSFFHGPTAGLFGGIKWLTPIDGLSIIAEYSSDAYTPQTISGNFDPRTQMNYGVSYQAFDNVTLGMAWFYGRSIEGSVSFALDPTTDPFPQHFADPPIPPAHLRSPAEQQQALNMLLQQRQQPAGTVIFSSSGLNALSDALFAETVNIADVSMRGRTLMIIIGAGDVRSACSNAAAMAARYSVDLDGVVATDATGRSAHCAVQRRGSRALVNATLSQNPGAGLNTLTLTPAALLTIDASAPAQPSTQSAVQTIKADAAKQDVAIQAISLTDSDAVIYYSNLRYSHEDDAVKRLVRVLLADAPPNIEKFRLLPTLAGVPQAEFDILRGPTERTIAQTGSYSLLDNGNTLNDAPLQNPVLSDALKGTYPKFGWSIFPQFRQELFDPNNPFAVQFLAAVQGVVELQPGLSAAAEGEANIYDNYNVNRAPGSLLPHVRTDWTRFFTEGKNGLGQVELDYLTRLAPDVFAQARVGYLESMYAGAGGEVLWRPEGQRWAIDADIYHVQERAFDRLFGLQKYQITTGHVTFYYASPWYGLNFQLRAGQYLAGDRGVTFEISRRFSTGVELGAFFTKTNVSALQFGEGSFDKGFIITIPLDYVVPVSNQSGITTIIRPVQRDGGQALEGDANLYPYLQRTGTAEVMAHAADLTGPE